MYNWKTNINVSEALIDHLTDVSYPRETNEGFCRAIVHKSYYACFHKVLEINNLNGLSSATGGNDSHTDAIDCIYNYENSIDKTTKTEIVNKMRQLKKYRTNADYESTGAFSFDRAKYIHRIAKETYEKLDNL